MRSRLTAGAWLHQHGKYAAVDFSDQEARDLKARQGPQALHRVASQSPLSGVNKEKGEDDLGGNSALPRAFIYCAT